MDGRQSYEVIHKGGLMESETETENYKNTSMPPSARLEKIRKKNPLGPYQRSSLVPVHQSVPYSQAPSPPFPRLV